MMIKIGIFFIGLSFLIAFYTSQIWAGYYLTSFTYEIIFLYPLWLPGIILIFIGYYRKSKSDEHAKELKEKSKDKK